MKPKPKKSDGKGKRDGLLTTGEMARLSGNTLRTVRFYEETGLLEPAERTEGGHRLFCRAEYDKLCLVSELRSAGLSLEDIKSMLEVKQHASSGGEAAQDVIGRLERQIAVMNDRIELLGNLKSELEVTKGHLSKCVGCKDRAHFPDSCGNCEVMADARRITKAMSVLWSVERCRADE